MRKTVIVLGLLILSGYKAYDYYGTITSKHYTPASTAVGNTVGLKGQVGVSITPIPATYSVEILYDNGYKDLYEINKQSISTCNVE